MKPDVKMGFWVGTGLLLALILWRVLAKLGLGALSTAGAVA